MLCNFETGYARSTLITVNTKYMQISKLYFATWPVSDTSSFVDDRFTLN